MVEGLTAEKRLEIITKLTEAMGILSNLLKTRLEKRVESFVLDEKLEIKSYDTSIDYNNYIYVVDTNQIGAYN